MLRITSPLPPDLDSLVTRTIGCCVTVHRALGPGLLEIIYTRALALELGATAISYEREKVYPVQYRGEVLCEQRIDCLVSKQIVLEIKSVESIAPVHHSQLLSYMRVAGVRVGLLVNFNVPLLKEGIKRKIL